ncbi:hypothetical protein ACI8AF_12285 [Blastococcus sp. SYSU D00669]
MTHDTQNIPAPEGLRTRGTVVVVPGRGETPATYGRFGRRLAADAYAVRVVAPPALDDLDGLVRTLSAAVPDDLVRPLVLVGADAGAVALAALTAQPAPDAAWWPDALVLAGLPGYGASTAGGWAEELDARTHCPVHRGVLGDDPGVVRDSLRDAVPDGLLDVAYGSTSPLPQLLLAGDADPVADREALARAAKARPAARLTVVRGAHHDVLNDLQHRSVAAEVVGFLEALRGGPAPAPVLEVVSSAW